MDDSTAAVLTDAPSRIEAAVPAPLEVVHPRVPPVRGLVPLHNHRGVHFQQIDVIRWLRVCRTVFKTQKVDLFFSGPIPGTLLELINYITDPGRSSAVAPSLMTDCTAPPDGLAAFARRPILDVHLVPRSLDDGHAIAWLDACKSLDLGVRLSITPPFRGDAEELAERIAGWPVRVVNLTIDPPFREMSRVSDPAKEIKLIGELAGALEARGIEANIIGLPFCLVDEQRWPNVANSLQGYLDHQQYHQRSIDLARDLYRRAPWVVAKIVQINQARYTSRRTIIDNYLLAFLVREYIKVHSIVALFRRLVRHVKILSDPLTPCENTQEAYVAAVDALQKKRDRALGPVCSHCRMHRICDRGSMVFKRAMGRTPVRAIEGDACASSMQFAQHQPKYYDPVDKARLELPAAQHSMVQHVRDIISNMKPDREFGFFDIQLENAFCLNLPGAVQWFSLTRSEITSTPLAWLDAPYTVSVTFGGGLADQIGFAIGRHVRLMCPMEAYSHKLALHVDKEGRYVFLRDGVLMRPTEFAGAHILPARVPTVAPVRLSCINIDRYLFTQNVLIFEGDKTRRAAPPQLKYSVVIVSTRFTRRLQAVLRCLAHQRDFDMRKLEIIVAYVPGLDATDDLLSSIEMTYPDLRIVRSPFTEDRVHAKGFIINESAALARGEYILVLDSDILVPPDMFAHIEQAPPDATFVAPDRRKMLTPETTAKILLGEIDPWEEWESLIKGPGKMRIKESGFVPIGFFQCIRAEHFRENKYPEYNHFQGADWDFILKLYQENGPGHWLNNVAVLHLDHGGSQWWGAPKHM